ncbi:MAG: helix-turn-helix transcriptional regulator [Tissierellia bacterium]|mgnify:CR=1 FL=1|jgi:transcriptional regulator with XRE-family HTH domain|nr:helix-turn-helix transcriptional regulator [Tissierellia bacterium]
MLFAEKIRQLREEKQLLQRQVSAALEMDNALYCKIERGDRIAKREQVVKLAKLFEVDSDTLLSLWLADKLFAVISDENELAGEAINIVLEQIKRN